MVVAQAAGAGTASQYSSSEVVQNSSFSSSGLALNKGNGGVQQLASNTGNINLNGALLQDAAPNQNNPFTKLFESQINQVV